MRVFETVYGCLVQVCSANLCQVLCLNVDSRRLGRVAEAEGEYGIMGSTFVPIVQIPSHIVVQAAEDMRDEGGEEISSEDKVNNQLSRRPKGSRITPLAAAAFRSNWFLFRKIYDLYETRTGKRWSRAEVSNLNGRIVPARTIFQS